MASEDPNLRFISDAEIASWQLLGSLPANDINRLIGTREILLTTIEASPDKPGAKAWADLYDLAKRIRKGK